MISNQSVAPKVAGGPVYEMWWIQDLHERLLMYGSLYVHVAVGVQSSHLERGINQIIHLSILPIHYRKSQHEPGRGWRVIDHDKNVGPITNKQLCSAHAHAHVPMR